MGESQGICHCLNTNLSQKHPCGKKGEDKKAQVTEQPKDVISL